MYRTIEAKFIKKGSIGRNIVSNFFLFIVNLTFGLILTPFLVNELGIGAYGMIPLATSFISYVTLVTVAINGSLARFLIIDIKRKNYQDASRTFSSALVGLLIILALILLVFSGLIFNLTSLISIPFNYVLQTKILFALTLVSVAISTLSSLFNSSAYINNRLDLSNNVTVLTKLVSIIIIILLISTNFFSLSGYGTSVLVGYVVGGLYSYKIFKEITPQIEINFKLFDRQTLKYLLIMGGWMVVNQLGTLLFLQTDIFVINILKGAEASGVYSVLLQWSILIRTITAVLGGVISPIILNYYATNNNNEIGGVASKSIKYLGIFTSILIMPLCLMSGEIIELWLGVPFVQYKWIFFLLIIHLGFNLCVSPLFSINAAYNKVKIPGIFACIVGLLNFALGFVILKYTDMGLYGVALVGFITLSLKNFFFLPLYSSNILNLSLFHFYRAIVPSIIITLITAALSLIEVDLSYFGNNWIKLILAIGTFIIVALSVSFFVFNDEEERVYLKRIINTKG